MTLSHLIGLTSWEQGCGQAFLGDSLRSPRPCDLLACQLASRREDHGQVSIIMSVLFYAIRPCNDLDTIVANGRKQTVLHLFLDAALKTVAYLRVSTRSQDLANQKLAILEFSQKRRFTVAEFIEARISSRKSPLERRRNCGCRYPATLAARPRAPELPRSLPLLPFRGRQRWGTARTTGPERWA